MTDLAGLAAGCVLASFRGTAVPGWLQRKVEGGLGGVCIYGPNVVDPDQLATVTAALHRARPGVVVALDEEGGDVTRVEFATGSSWPGNAALGVVDDLALTAAVAGEMGDWLAALGFDLDLAPCLDVNSNPANPVIGVRSFGASAALVARHGGAFVTALQAAGVAACAKHFPGHGDTAADSHLALPRVEAGAEVVRERELVPFRAAIEADVAAIMTGHLLVLAFDDRQPATLSRPVLGDLLRGELGFAGAVVSDALDMAGVNVPAAGGIPAAAVAALAAGVDLLCLGSEQDEADLDAVVNAIVAAVGDGRLSEERLADAAARTARLARQGRDGAAAGLRTGGGAPRQRGDAAETGPGAQTPRQRGDVAGTGPGTGAPRQGGDAAARAIQVAGDVPALAGAFVVELRPDASIPSGAVPWGLAAPMRALDPSVSTTTLGADDDPRAALADVGERPLVVVVRDAHRHGWPARALATLAAARPDLVAVELGWPGPDPLPGRAVVHTFGASRVSTAAAAELLLGRC